MSQMWDILATIADVLPQKAFISIFIMFFFSRKMVQVVAGQSTLGSGHWTLLECIDGKVLLEIHCAYY